MTERRKNLIFSEKNSALKIFFFLEIGETFPS